MRRAWPARLWPSSLAAQTSALLVTGLVAAHIVSLLVFSGERSHAIRFVMRGELVERIATLVEVLDEAPPELAQRIAAALGSRRTRLSIDPTSAVPSEPMDPEEAALSAELAATLSLGARVPLVSLDEERASGAKSRRGRSREALMIAIPLGDARWLNAATGFRTPQVEWSWPWLVSLAASAVAILGIVAVVVRRITGPMRALAAAAERVGRGEATEPIPPRGPAEIRTTVEAFNAMQQRLSRFVRDRTRMIAAISHDLRTPITSLRLRAEFIEDEELKAGIVRTLDEMQAITNATLAFSQDEAGGEETRNIDLAALLEGLVEDQAAMGRNVSYSGPERLPWRCRPVSLKRAVGNLVENAVRYAGAARLGLSRAETGVRIVVEDDGPGIPEARMEDVFEPFVRIESSRSRETGGAGLGLSIARSIARAHGGELTLANRAEGGLRATLLLP